MKDKGFTILEILVALIIIAILAAIAVPRYLELKNKHQIEQSTSIEQVQPKSNQLEPLE